MVAKPLTSPTAWIWWTHAVWRVGGLAHVRSDANVEAIWLIQLINVKISLFMSTAMINWNRSHPPATMVAKTASLLVVASPDAACPGLHQKPLDVAIGQLLAPYHPGGHQGDNQHNDDATCTHFAGHFDGHRDAAVLSHSSPHGGGSWLSWKPLNATIGQALTPILPIGHTNTGCFGHFIVKKSSSRGMTYQTDEKNPKLNGRILCWGS